MILVVGNTIFVAHATSCDPRVLVFLYLQRAPASPAMRLKISFTMEFKVDMADFLIVYPLAVPLRTL